MNLKSILLLAFFPVYCLLCWKYYVCNIKNLCPESETQEVARTNHPIQFYKNTNAYILGNFDNYADSLIGVSQSKKIDLVGYYTAAEINSTSYENLGMARAHLLKELLVNRGLDSNRVQLFGELQDMKFQDSLSVAHTWETSADIDLTSKDVQLVSHHGVTEIYFPSNSKEEITSEALSKYLSSLVTSAKDSKVRLIGHTDNIGSEEANKALSLKRTYTVRNQLIKLGMPTSNILCEGRGSSSPKVNNSTPENRALNRRVEVKVQ
jgi:outer membrane protein OmpA-like peptidoglycan-associated protein